MKIFTSAAQAVCAAPVFRTAVPCLAGELLELSPVAWQRAVVWQRVVAREQVWAIALVFSPLKL